MGAIIKRAAKAISRTAKGRGRLSTVADLAVYAMKRAAAVFISDEAFIRAYYRLHIGRHLNLRQPVTFTEKLQWLKLHYRLPEMTRLVDKYAVRDYVKETVGEDYLIPLIGLYRSPDEIDIDELPESFVLKPTHGSGWVILCQDKAKVDWVRARKRLRTWMRRNYYYHAREWAYKDVNPRIVCEAYLSDASGNVPPDYKVFCFAGTPAFIQVDVDRFEDHRRDYYDTSWNRLDVKVLYPQSERPVPKPDGLDTMLQVAAALASPFPFCRIDLYAVGSRIYFGEITFIPDNGIGPVQPPEYDRLWGALLPDLVSA
jgi:hypothetical protein